MAKEDLPHIEATLSEFGDFQLREIPLRQCFGIDIAKDTFTACHCVAYIDRDDTFDNNRTGFNQFMKWARKNALKKIEMSFLMEATGTYYEPLAFHLHKIGQTVYVVNPRKTNSYCRWLKESLKTDDVDARTLSMIGSNDKGVLKVWQPPSQDMQALRQLTRTISQLVEHRVAVENQKKALDSGHAATREAVKSLDNVIKALDKEIERCEMEIKKIADANPQMKEDLRRMTTIKGIGFRTAAIIYSETNGFEMITSRKQLAAFAGFGIVIRDSGKDRGKRMISKKGNVYIRRALYMPALTAITYNPHIRTFNARIMLRHPDKAKVAITACMRKLLTLCFTLWKNKTDYDPTFGM